MESPLTSREEEILILVMNGCTYKDIADRLHLSIHTVKTHVRFAIARLDAKNTIHAIIIAINNGYINSRSKR